MKVKEIALLMYTANFKRFNSVSEKDDKEYVKTCTKCWNR